ncbi:DUF6603 domain-containing protein, partial [Streptomyces formicae]
PSLEDRGSFPLVERLQAGADGEPPKWTAQEVLEALTSGDWLLPNSGRVWVAGGVHYSIHQYIDAHALLLPHDGKSFGLYADTSLRLPPTNSLMLGYVFAAFTLVHTVAAGRLSADTLAGPGSYMLSEGNSLEGGFSVYAWVGGPTEGEFVLSAGGYHPDYPVPAHYPKTEPLSTSWSPANNCTLVGRVYWTVTGQAKMCGGSLALDYDAGGSFRLQAWSHVGFDALLQWKPAHVSASVRVSVGVAATVKIWFVRVRVSLEVGIDLSLWFPRMGGRATIKVWFVSFTLAFGTGLTAPPGVSWPEFIEFEPAGLSCRLVDGLLPDVAPDEAVARTSRNAPQLVSFEGFALTVQTLPNTHITLNSHPLYDNTRNPDQQLHIRPMDHDDINSTTAITLTHATDHTTTPIPIPYPQLQEEGWDITPHTDNVPRALWGISLNNPDDAHDEPPLRTLITGLDVTVPPPVKSARLGPITQTALSTEDLNDGHTPLQNHTPQGTPPHTAPTLTHITHPETGIATTITTTNRTTLHTHLHTHAPGTNTTPTHYQDQALTHHTHHPLTTTPNP